MVAVGHTAVSNREVAEVDRGDDEENTAVLTSIVAGVATITMTRPERRNVLDADSISALQAAFDRCAGDDVRVVVLAAVGPIFCAGADLRGAAAASDGSFASSAPVALATLLATMIEHPKPIVAAVEGDVFGGGNGLVAACDIAVAAESARFAFSEVRVGVAPAVVSVVCLARMNSRPASRLMLTGERVSASVVLDAGLITEVVEAGAVITRVRAYVDQLVRGGPQAVAATKELLRRVPALSVAEGFQWTAELSARLFGSEEGREGMAAFVEKRDPNWVPKE